MYAEDMNTKTILHAGIAILVGAGVGYWLGYDHGYEKGVGENMPTEEVSDEVGNFPEKQEEDIVERLVGVWRSEEDSGFTREYRGTGTVIDSHEGASGQFESMGTWRLFTAQDPITAPFELDNDATYIRHEMEGETFDFRIVSLTSDRLTLVYMDRGGILEFVRER